MVYETFKNMLETSEYDPCNSTCILKEEIIAMEIKITIHYHNCKLYLSYLIIF